MKALIAFLLFCSVASIAQTISPVTAEYGKGKAKGEVKISNDQLSTLNVTLNARGMNRDKQLTNTDATIKLSQYSARIAPKQTRTIYYDVTCQTLPCAVVIFAHMVNGHSNNGVQVVAGVGETVYICQKEKDCRKSYLK